MRVIISVLFWVALSVGVVAWLTNAVYQAALNQIELHRAEQIIKQAHQYSISPDR
jgi:hypothetical protein